jgi:hypothetical protein
MTLSRGGNETVINKREFIGDILGSKLFRVTSYQLNPGLEGVFPWISPIAQRYERYRFESLRFEYVTRFATTDRGSVLYGYDYDAKDQPPTTEQQLAAYEGTVEAPPYRDFSVAMKAGQLSTGGTQKFVRSGAISGDLSLYDAGQFLLATTGFVNDDEVCGKLWVSYRVRLITPQLHPVEPDGAYPAGASTVYANNTEEKQPQNTLIEFIGMNKAPEVDNLGLGNTDAKDGGITFKQPGCYRITGSVNTDYSGVTTNPGAANAELVVIDPVDGKYSTQLSTTSTPPTTNKGRSAWSRIFNVLRPFTKIIPCLVMSGYTSGTSGTLALADLAIEYLGPQILALA